MDTLREQAKNFEGMEINKDELRQTVANRQVIPAASLKKKKKKKLKVLPKASSIKAPVKRAAVVEPEKIDAEMAPTTSKKKARIVNLDNPVVNDEQASIIEELREQLDSLTAQNERLELRVAAGAKSDADSLQNYEAFVKDIASRIPFLKCASDEDGEEPPIPPPDNLSDTEKISYLVENFHSIAVQYARENLMPQIQEQVEAIVEEIRQDHAREIAAYKEQLENKDWEYDRQTQFLEEREEEHQDVSKAFKMYREIDTEEYLKKASETDAVLQMTDKALAEETRRKNLALRKAEVAKAESLEAKKVASALKKKVKSLEAKVIDLNKEYSVLQSKFVRLNGGKQEEKEKKEFQVETGAQTKARVEELEAQVTKAHWDKATVEQELKEKKEELRKLQISYKKMEREMIPIAKERDQFRKQLNASKGKVKDLTKEFQDKLEKAEKKAEDHEKVSKRAREAARTAREQLTQSESALDIKVSEKTRELQEKLNLVQDDLDREILDSMSYQDYVKVADSERDDALRKLACFQKENATLKEYNQKWVEAGKSWKENEAAWVKEKAALFNAIKTTKAESAELKKKIEDLKVGSEAGAPQVDNSVEVEDLKKEIDVLTKQKEECEAGIVQLEKMLKVESQKVIALEENGGGAGGDPGFSAVIKKIALAHATTILTIITTMGKIGFADTEQLKIVAQRVHGFLKALVECDTNGSNVDLLTVIDRFISEAVPCPEGSEPNLFPQANSGLDICRAAFIRIAERWMSTVEQARSDAQKYQQSIREQHKLYTKELTAFKLAASSVDNGNIEEALVAHVEAMEKIKETKDGARALAEVQHMQSFVAFIKHHLEWSAEDDE